MSRTAVIYDPVEGRSVRVESDDTAPLDHEDMDTYRAWVRGVFERHEEEVRDLRKAERIINEAAQRIERKHFAIVTVIQNVADCHACSGCRDVAIQALEVLREEEDSRKAGSNKRTKRVPRERVQAPHDEGDDSERESES